MRTEKNKWNDICTMLISMFSETVIEKPQVLGFATARVHVIKFQKRVLPDCNMLIWIDKRNEPGTEEGVDSIICAEIPDRTTNPRLYKFVVAHMIHGPCGSIKKRSLALKATSARSVFSRNLAERRSSTKTVTRRIEEGMPAWYIVWKEDRRISK